MKKHLKRALLTVLILVLFCQIPVLIQWWNAEREIIHASKGDYLIVKMHSNKALWNLGLLCEPSFLFIGTILRYEYLAEAPAEDESIYMFGKKL